MRVLLISTDDRLAAREAINDVQLRHVAYAQRIGEIDILVRVPRGSGSAPVAPDSKLRIHPVQVVSAVDFLPAALGRARSIPSLRAIDVVSSQDPFISGLTGLVLSRLIKRPFNVQLHSDQINNPYFLTQRPSNRLLNVLGKKVVSRAHTVRVVNRRAWRMCREWGVPEKRCEYVPLVFGLEPFWSAKDKGMKKRLTGGDPQALLLLYVGRFEWEKGWDVLINAFERVARENPKSLLIMIGSGRDEGELRQRIRRLNLDERVCVEGRIPHSDLPAYYAAADVCVVPSRYEGFGRSILEAQAAGRAVVATETAGAMDLIRDGKTGMLVKMPDPLLMAGITRTLGDDDEVRSMLGKMAARETRARWESYDLAAELRRLFEKTARLG